MIYKWVWSTYGGSDSVLSGGVIIGYPGITAGRPDEFQSRPGLCGGEHSADAQGAICITSQPN